MNNRLISHNNNNILRLNKTRLISRINNNNRLNNNKLLRLRNNKLLRLKNNNLRLKNNNLRLVKFKNRGLNRDGLTRRPKSKKNEQKNSGPSRVSNPNRLHPAEAVRARRAILRSTTRIKTSVE